MKKSFRRGEKKFYELFPQTQHKCDSMLTHALQDILDVHTYQSLRNAIERGVGVTPSRREKIQALFESVGISNPFDPEFSKPTQDE